jgi:hypothetical protein
LVRAINAAGASRNDVSDARQRAGQHVQRTALIVQVQDAVVMIGVRRHRGDADMVVAGGRRRLVDVERMLVHQRRHAGDLRKREQPEQNGSQPTDRSHERHAPLPQ